MKNIFILLLLFSSGLMGQGISSVIFIPGQGWVSKKLVDSSWVGTNLTAAISTATATNFPESQITNLTTDLGNKQGLSVAATSATTGTITVAMTTATQTIFTITPTNACTFNASGGKAGARMTFVVTTSGSSSFILTFGTNFKSIGTLTTGVTTAKIFTVSFVCTNGTQWVETGRTTAM